MKLAYEIIKAENPALIASFIEKSKNLFVQKFSYFIMSNIGERYNWMAQDMIVGLKNANMTQDDFLKILSYFKVSCEQLQIVD